MNQGRSGHICTKNRLKVCTARISCMCSAHTDWGWRLSFQGIRQQGCQAGQVGGSKVGDCHRVAPLLPQPLICPACTGLRGKSWGLSPLHFHLYHPLAPDNATPYYTSSLSSNLQLQTGHPRAGTFFLSVPNVLAQSMLLQHFTCKYVIPDQHLTPTAKQFV